MNGVLKFLDIPRGHMLGERGGKGGMNETSRHNVIKIECVTRKSDTSFHMLRCYIGVYIVELE